MLVCRWVIINLFPDSNRKYDAKSENEKIRGSKCGCISEGSITFLGNWRRLEKKYWTLWFSKLPENWIKHYFKLRNNPTGPDAKWGSKNWSEYFEKYTGLTNFPTYLHAVQKSTTAKSTNCFKNVYYTTCRHKQKQNFSVLESTIYLKSWYFIWPIKKKYTNHCQSTMSIERNANNPSK